MAKIIDLSRTVFELVEEYPELVDLMAGLGFTEITKKAMLHSVGKLMTIPKGAKAKGIDMLDVVAALVKAGFTIEGEMPSGAAASAQEAEAVCFNERTEQLKGYLRRLGEDYQRALSEMLLLDAVICNTDRHFGNFGFLVDNASNQIIAPAPLFDHGNSLFNFAGSDCWTSTDALEAYADTLLPSVYDDFFGTAKSHMSSTERERVRKLLDFRFKRHSRCNLAPKRLKMIEDQIHKRARRLLV